PGMDHAGIATQSVVESKLREEGKTRYDLGREQFIETAWDWKEDYAKQIREQWGKLGLELDYSKERYTLDEKLSEAVQEVCIKLYNKGLIFRGEYIINWGRITKIALSDMELFHDEINGNLYHMCYPTKDSKGTIDIATTRPAIL